MKLRRSLLSQLRILAVADIDDPSTELNAIQGPQVGSMILCYEVHATYNESTIYSWDSADSGSESVPYKVDGSSGMWIAIAGKYVHPITASHAEINKLDRSVADGIVEASKVLVADADKYILGLQNFADLSYMPAPYYYFDGVNDKIDISNSTVDYATGDLTIFCSIYGKGLPSLGAAGIFVKGSTEDSWGIQLESTGYITCGIRGTSTKTVATNAALSLNIWYDVAFVYSATGTSYLYINGVLNNSADLTGSGYIFTSEVIRVGNHVTGGSANYPNIRVNNIALFTNALSGAEVKAFQNGSIPFKYQGASQTEHLDETDFATHAKWDVTNDFDDTGGNATYEWSANQTSTLTQVNGNMAVAPIGKKRYRLTYTCSVITPPDEDLAMILTTGIASSAVNLAFTAGTHSYKFTTKASPGDFVIQVVSGTDTEGLFSLDDIHLIQIGRVAEYAPDGIGHIQWKDKSGNELHGLISGATPHNLPTFKKYTDRYLAKGADFTFDIPEGCCSLQIRTEVTTQQAATNVRVGTGAAGQQVVANVAVAAQGWIKHTMVIDDMANFDAGDTLYYSSDNGWASLIVDVYVTYEVMEGVS